MGFGSCLDFARPLVEDTGEHLVVGLDGMGPIPWTQGREGAGFVGLKTEAETGLAGWAFTAWVGDRVLGGGCGPLEGFLHQQNIAGEMAAMLQFMAWFSTPLSEFKVQQLLDRVGRQIPVVYDNPSGPFTAATWNLATSESLMEVVMMRAWAKVHAAGVSFLPVHVHSHVQGVVHPRAQSWNDRADAVTPHLVAPGGPIGDVVYTRGLLELSPMATSKWDASRFHRRLVSFHFSAPIPPSASEGTSTSSSSSSPSPGAAAPGLDSTSGSRPSRCTSLALHQKRTVPNHRITAVAKLHARKPADRWVTRLRVDKNHLAAVGKLLARRHLAPWDVEHDDFAAVDREIAELDAQIWSQGDRNLHEK